MGMLSLLSLAVGVTVYHPVTIVAQANTSADQQAINEIMPNQKLQRLVLLNMKHEKIVDPSFELSDFTLETFKADLAKLKALEWPIGTKEEDAATEPVDGGNGALGPVNQGSYSLKGIEYATNLTELSLGADYNQGHGFRQMDITDITPLESLTKLTYIDLSGNRISDISPIENLKNVKTLYINDNCITNLNVLDRKQYTDGFNYLGQVVVLPAKDLSSNSYIWKAPFKDALPKNAETTETEPYEPYNPKWISAGSMAAGFPSEGGSPYQHIQVFWNGLYGIDEPRGKAEFKGDDIEYSGLARQIEPGNFTKDPWGTDAQIIQNPYTYYITAVYRFFPGGGNYSFSVLTYLLPYTITPNLAKPVMVDYVDDQGNQLHESQTITGKIGQTFDLSSPQYKLAIPGYTFKRFEPGQTATISDQLQTYKLVYTKNPASGGSGSSGGSASPSQPGTEPTLPTPPTEPGQPELTLPPTQQLGEKPQPTPIPTKKAVYALKKIYLYRHPNFKKSEREASYVKKPRVFRPMFVVNGVQYSKAGRLRYQVRDVNHQSKSAGQIGFITAKASYVRSVYYRANHPRLTVINPRGVKAYRNRNLTEKVAHFKQGTLLKVTGFVKHRLTTRYQLSNGDYITGNRKLVKMGRQKMPKQVTVKRPIYRYRDANFAKRNGNFKKGTRLKVIGYTFSHATSLSKSGTKRLLVKGGYITANQRFVKILNK